MKSVQREHNFHGKFICEHIWNINTQLQIPCFIIKVLSLQFGLKHIYATATDCFSHETTQN